MLEGTNDAADNKSLIKLMINITPKQNHNFHIKQPHKINMTKQKAKEQKITVIVKDRQQPRSSTLFIATTVRRLKPIC